ncbi:unnamed protein product [Closterium sp. NIES-53]
MVRRGEISDADMELMIEGARSKWARDHPPPRAEVEIESASPRAEGKNVNIDGNEGARVTRGEMRGAIRVHTASVGGTQAQVLRSAAAASARSDAHGRRNPARSSGGGPSWTANASTPSLEIAQLKKFVDGTMEVPPEDDAERRALFHSAQLLTFMVILRCCSPVVQVALKPCRLRVDAGFQAWQFIMKTYKAMDDLYVGQLEQRLTNLEMGEHESATAYYNRAQQILADLRMAGVDYSMSLYVTHVIKGLPESYNLSTGFVVGLVLAWAEPTSGSSVRSAADLQQRASWSTGLGVDLGDADQRKPTGCGRLTGVLVDLELVDQKGCRPGVGRPGEWSTWTPQVQPSTCGRLGTCAMCVAVHVVTVTLHLRSDVGVVDSLEARLKDARRSHEANEYGPNLPLAVIEAGIRSVWAEEHPARPASPRPVNNEGGVDVGVYAGGDQVGSSAGGTSRQRGVIHADEVGSVQARWMRLSAVAGSSQGSVGGRRSSLSPMSVTHVMAGGIAPSYGYFKFTPDRISVTPLLVGRLDILTWKEAIKPQLEMAGLIGFTRGTVATPEEHCPDLRAEFHAVQLLTFTVISRCCSPGVQIVLKSCREYLDAGHRAWHFIESTYQVTNALYIGHIEEQLSHIRMGKEETATDYCNRARAHEQLQPAETTVVNYVAPVKQGGQPGQRGQSRGGGSRGWKPTKDTNKKKSAKDSGRGGGSRRRECRLCGEPNYLSFECYDHSDSDDDNAKGGHGRSGSRRPRQGRNQPRKEKKSTKSSTLAKDADSSAGNKGRDDKEASCSLVGVVEPTVSLASEAGEDFQAMAATVQANPAVVLFDSGCSHHLIVVDLQPSGDVKHVRGFNGALQDVQGRGTVALQGEAARQVLISEVLYVPGMRANLLLAGQLKENGVKLQEDSDGMLLVSAAGDVLGRASYTGRVLCTDLRPCSAKSTTPTTKVVALRAIVSVTKSTPDRLHARLAHVGMNTIRSSGKHEVATGLDLKSASGADLPCVSCIGGKLARHTFPDQGSDADDVLAVVHVDLCGPFLVAAKDGSLYFLLLKDCKTCYVWVRPVAKKSDALQELVQWQAVTERQTKKSVLMLRSDRGGEFLGKQFTNFVNSKGIVHDLTCPYTLQPNGMAEREMRTVVESVRTMLLHMGWGLHLDVSEESKGWELLDIADNRVVTTSDVVFYENMSLEVWKSEHGPASGRAPTIPPTDTSTATLPVLAEVGEGEVGNYLWRRPRASPVADVKSSKSTPPGEEQAEEVQPTVVKSAKGAGTRPQLIGEQAAAKPTKKQSATRQSAGEPTTGEKLAGKPAEVYQDDEGSEAGDDGGDAEESTDSDVVEVQRRPRQSGRISRPPDFYVPAAFTTAYDEVDDDRLYDEAEEDEDFPELDLDMHADSEHRWDISTMTVKREKARLVVKGFTQVYGADYDKTYAPVSSYVTLRIFLSIVAILDLNLMQLDMKNAFLQSKLDRVLYMYQPDYFNDGTGRGSRRCAAGRWLEEEPGRHVALLQTMLKELLKAAFELQEISPVQKYLGLEIVRDRLVRKLWLHQQGYTDKLRRRFLDEEQNGRTPKTPVSVDRCLAYLANTRDTALEFGGGAKSLKLVGYVVADDAGDKQNRTSTGGYVFVFGGAAISWSSLRIKCATLSSTESEYVAATEVGKEGRRLRFLLAEFRQMDAGTSTVLRVDNKLAITVAEGMGLTGNLKHIERRQAWLQHMVKRGKFSLRYIPTAEQPTDFLTKALHYPAFNRCSVAIGHVHLVDVGDGDNDVQQ